MRCVFRTENLIDAYLVKDVLEQTGIPVFVAGESLSDGLGRLSGAGFIAVMVPDTAIDAALRAVHEIVTMLDAPRPRAAADDPALDGGGWLPMPA